MEKLFTLLSIEEKKLFIIKEYAKDETVFYENNKCEHLGIVLSGVVNITSYTYEGNELIYNVLKDGDIFGNNLLFSNEPYYRGNVVVKEKARIALINHKNLLYLFHWATITRAL